MAHPSQPDMQALETQFLMLQKRDFARIEAQQPRLVYVFKHNITQEVVYQTLLESQRQDLHVAVAEAIEARSPDDVERLAHHYGQGDTTLPRCAPRPFTTSMPPAGVHARNMPTKLPWRTLTGRSSWSCAGSGSRGAPRCCTFLAGAYMRRQRWRRFQNWAAAIHVKKWRQISCGPGFTLPQANTGLPNSRCSRRCRLPWRKAINTARRAAITSKRRFTGGRATIALRKKDFRRHCASPGRRRDGWTSRARHTTG